MDLNNIDKALQNVTGRDFLAAEREARQQGDQTLSIALSSQFQITLLARAMKVPGEDIEALPIKDFVQVLGKVNAFLFAQE